MEKLFMISTCVMQRSEKDAVGLHARFAGQPTALQRASFHLWRVLYLPAPPPPPALHVLSLPNFSFLFKSKAKKDILKDWVQIHPTPPCVQTAATSAWYFNKEKLI